MTLFRREAAAEPQLLGLGLLFYFLAVVIAIDRLFLDIGLIRLCDGCCGV